MFGNARKNLGLGREFNGSFWRCHVNQLFVSIQRTKGVGVRMQHGSCPGMDGMDYAPRVVNWPVPIEDPCRNVNLSKLPYLKLGPLMQSITTYKSL